MGGYLSVVKLTGKMENETAKGFTVRTPTATVTDLGTEFGVEVSKAGLTTSHVFRGAVKVQPLDVNARKEVTPSYSMRARQSRRRRAATTVALASSCGESAAIRRSSRGA